MHKRKVILIPAEEGGYIAEVPSLPGCYSQGDSIEEAMKNINDAMDAFIESLKKRGENIPPEDIEAEPHRYSTRFRISSAV